MSCEEQSDERFILYFNGETDIQKLADEEVLQPTESWSVDSNDETMYFSLDHDIGWRLVVTDAAGSRFYVMEKTKDGGFAWKCINGDPFSGQAGVAEGNFGHIGVRF